MVRRARKWLLIALIAAGFGFTGLLRSTAVIAQAVFYVSSSFVVLSLLFGLFEESEPVPMNSQPPQAKVIPLPTLSEPVRQEARWRNRPQGCVGLES